VICLLIFTITYSATAQDDPQLHMAMQSLETKMAEAFSAGNASQLANFYNKAAHLLEPGEEDLIGRDAIAAAFQGLMDSGAKTANFTTVEVNYVHKYHTGWAYEQGTYLLQTEDGSTFDQGNYLIIWNRPKNEHHWNAYYDIFVSQTPSAVNRAPVDRSLLKSAEALPAVPADSALMQAIQDGNDAWMTAYDNGDSAAVAACYCSNATVLANHAMPIGAMQGGVASIELNIVEVNVAYDDNVAYEKSTYIFKDQFGNVLDTGKYIVVWRMEEGSYKLYIDCFNSDKAR